MRTYSVSVGLTEEEYKALVELAQLQEMSEERVLVQGLRLYQLQTHHGKQGHQMVFLDASGNRLGFFGGCGGHD